VDPAACTLIEWAYASSGSMLKAARVVAFVSAWAVTARELGRDPAVDEYAEWWGEPLSTAYKHLGEFRAVFPGAETPAAVVELMDDATWRKRSTLDLRPVVAGARRRPLTA
jgi:hypothetical protein